MSDQATPAAGNADLFAILRGAMQAVHKTVGLDVRNQHPKTHGVVRATFEVADLPESYAVGLFAQPQCFPAWIRFSNGRERDDDRKPDVHGMAIKILGVPGGEGSTQDIVLANNPTFFARDAQHFLQFLAMKKAAGEAVAAAPDERKADVGAEFQAKIGKEFPGLGSFFNVVHSPLTETYHSQTVYRFGDRQVKYYARPVESGEEVSPIASETGLRDAITTKLASGPVQFEFGIEVQTDPTTMPDDDATVEWNSPEKMIVATLTIPPQEFHSDSHQAFGEALSFTPWHALPEHAPVGSLNQARQDAYIDSSRTRHETVDTPEVEPDVEHFNTSVLTAFFESFVQGDYRRMQACLHPDVEFTDIGFDIHHREVNAMWHMIAAKGVQVSFGEIKVTGQTATAHWECDYQFQRTPDSKVRDVHNVIESKFRFDGGLIREQHDSCDFWEWFEQAMGPIGDVAHLFDRLEGFVESVLKRDVPIDVEDRTRAKVRETARGRLEAFIGDHPEYTS